MPSPRETPDDDGLRVAVLDARRGSVLRAFTLPLGPDNNVATADGSCVVLTSQGVPVACTHAVDAGMCPQFSGIALLDARAGRLLRIMHTPDSPRDQILAVGLDAPAHRLVAASVGSTTPGAVSVFDSETGRLLRHVALRFQPVRVVMDETSGRAFVLASNTAIFNTSGTASALPPGAVYVFDTRTGALLRRVALQPIRKVPKHALSGCISLSNDFPDRLLAGAPGDIAVDRSGGRVFVTGLGPTRYIPHGPLGSGPGYALFRLLGPGDVQVLDARNGHALRTVIVGYAPMALAIDAPGRHVLVVNGGGTWEPANQVSQGTILEGPQGLHGSLSVLDGAGTHVERTIALGTTPTSIVLDERARQAFVGDSGDLLRPEPIRDRWRWLPSWVRMRVPFVPPAAPPSNQPSRIVMLDVSHF